jgi:hypothetical protein
MRGGSRDSALSGVVERARNFAELFEMIHTAVHPIPGLGELYVYDTALRIGAKLNLLPDKAYLHAGTRSGARALGLDARAEVSLLKSCRQSFMF